MTGRVGRVLFIVAVAAAFGVMGLVAAAYSARNILRLPATSATRAGPAWLFSGLGVGVAVGAALAVGLVFVMQRLHWSPRNSPRSN